MRTGWRCVRVYVRCGLCTNARRQLSWLLHTDVCCLFFFCSFLRLYFSITFDEVFCVWYTCIYAEGKKEMPATPMRWRRKRDNRQVLAKWRIKKTDKLVRSRLYWLGEHSSRLSNTWPVAGHYQIVSNYRKHRLIDYVKRKNHMKIVRFDMILLTSRKQNIMPMNARVCVCVQSP